MRTPQSELERRRLNERGRQILQRKAGTAVRPMREDGYVNLLNKYGTKRDNSEAYQYEREPMIPDMQLTSLYEGNGLFTKIIDAPAEEALKHGFDLNLKNEDIETFVEEALDDLDWEAKAATAIKWARLYGGAIIVMLIDDGRGLEEPVDWQHVRSIDELRVYERAIVQPDYASLYMQDYGGKGPGNRVSKFGQPEFYYVSSIYGSFKVHESRCLVFRNGVLPEQSTNSTYLFWGMPEYVRIRRALRETVTAHTDSTKLLERSVQAIYSMKGLAQMLSTDDGENNVLRRLEVIDMARGLLNSIAIDSDGESYDFKTTQFSGVKDVIDATCNMLSALTNIPQTKLFGRSPAGMNSTGDGDLENWYSFVEGLQKLMLKRNLRDLLDVIFRAGVASGEIEEEPKYKLTFNPLWSLSETEQAAVDQTKAQTALTKAQATQIYVDVGALDPSEVRTALASDEEYNVEDVVSEEDDLLDALLGGEPDAMNELEAAEKSAEQVKAPGGGEQSIGQPPAPVTSPTPQTDADTPTGVGVLVLEKGRVLCGTRTVEGTIGGPGGHIEPGETPEQAAIREAQEEFGITPKELFPIAMLMDMPEQYGVSQVYLCTDYDGHITCDGVEMSSPRFLTIEEAEAKSDALFLPFSLSISALLDALFPGEKSDLTAADNQGKVKDREDFEESKHPRDESGQFTSGGGASGGGAADTPAAPSVVSGKAPKPTHFSRDGDRMEVTEDTRIKIGSSQSRTVMVAGTLTGVSDFAGVKGKKPVEKEAELMAQYPQSKKGSWRHTLGYGQVRRKDGRLQDAEIHWFESDDVGQVGWKVKRFGKGTDK